MFKNSRAEVSQTTINNYFDCLEQGFSNWGTCTLRVHLDFSRGTLLYERISLFKLNSVSGRNNRLKYLEFSNPVNCYYIKQDN